MIKKNHTLFHITVLFFLPPLVGIKTSIYIASLKIYRINQPPAYIGDHEFFDPLYDNYFSRFLKSKKQIH